MYVTAGPGKIMDTTTGIVYDGSTPVPGVDPGPGYDASYSPTVPGAVIPRQSVPFEQLGTFVGFVPVYSMPPPTRWR